MSYRLPDVNAAAANSSAASSMPGDLLIPVQRQRFPEMPARFLHGLGGIPLQQVNA